MKTPNQWWKDRKAAEATRLSTEQAEADRQKAEAEVTGRQSSVAEWFKDKKFLEFINNAPDTQLSEEAMLDIESNPDTFAALERYHEIYKTKPDIEKSVKAVFEAALQTEFKGIDSKEKGKLPAELWEKIKEELDKEMLSNPEGVVELKKQMKEQAARIEQIKALERTLSQTKGGSKRLQEVQAHAEILANIDGAKLNKRDELTLEERTAYDSVKQYLHVGTAYALTPEQKKTLEERVATALKTEEDLAAKHDEIRQAADEVFGNHTIGKLLIQHAKIRHEQHFNQLTASLNSGEQDSVDRALDYLQDIAENKSHLDLKSDINIPNTESDIEALLEQKQLKTEAQFANELEQIALANTSLDELDRAMDKLLSPGKIGNKKGMTEIQPVLEDMFKKIYDGIPADQKSKKWVLTLFLKKHGLQGAL